MRRANRRISASTGATAGAWPPGAPLVPAGPLALLPFVLVVALVGRRWSGSRAARLAFTAVPAAFLAAGLVGWAFVPDVWTASLWVTIDASMNAAKYGGQFEHLAEHALMYFLYIGILGAFGSTIASIVVLKVSAR